MEPSRWSGKAILGITGTPLKLRPSLHAEADAQVEDFVKPQASKDDAAPGDGQRDGSLKFDSSDIKTLDRSIRITVKDLEYSGYSERRPRCRDLQAGNVKTTKSQSD